MKKYQYTMILMITFQDLDYVFVVHENGKLELSNKNKPQISFQACYRVE